MQLIAFDYFLITSQNFYCFQLLIIFKHVKQAGLTLQ